MNLSCCFYQVQRVVFGVISDSKLHALAVLFMITARECDHLCVLLCDYYIHCFIH